MKDLNMDKSTGKSVFQWVKQDLTPHFNHFKKATRTTTTTVSNNISPDSWTTSEVQDKAKRMERKGKKPLYTQTNLIYLFNARAAGQTERKNKTEWREREGKLQESKMVYCVLCTNRLFSLRVEKINKKKNRKHAVASLSISSHSCQIQ